MDNLRKIIFIQIDMEERFGLIIASILLTLFSHLFFTGLAIKISLCPKCFSLLFYPMLALETTLFWFIVWSLPNPQFNTFPKTWKYSLYFIKFLSIIKLVFYWRKVSTLAERLEENKHKLKEISQLINNVFIAILPSLWTIIIAQSLNITKYYYGSVYNTTDTIGEQIHIYDGDLPTNYNIRFLMYGLLSMGLTVLLILLFEELFTPFIRK
eukprot:snap_masked-scaffold_19-processed-gene-4.8-mRNA-1 protein AED:1.00 eAED:1.00 QI:0/-1/0/0/-1/1/1/0/210